MQNPLSGYSTISHDECEAIMLASASTEASGFRILAVSDAEV